MGNKSKGLARIAAVAFCGGLAGCSDSSPPAAPAETNNVPSAETGEADLDSLEALNSVLVKRVSDVVMERGGASPGTFVVTPFPVGTWEIGTVLQQYRSNEITHTVCSPLPDDGEMRGTSEAASFPAYSLSRQTNIEGGLDEAYFGGLLSVGGHLNFTSGIQFSVADASLELWSDAEVTQALASTSCLSVLTPGTTYRIVRGIVSGRREFGFELSEAGRGIVTAQAAAPDLQVSVGKRRWEVAVSDVRRAGLFAVVSEFTVPGAPGGAPSSSLPVLLVKPDAAVAEGVRGKVNMQRDSGDSSDDAIGVGRKLRAVGYDVASGIEEIPSDRMASGPQVRYFRPEDVSEADGVWQILRARCPGARLVTLRIPSLPGEIEVRSSCRRGAGDASGSRAGG